MVNRGWRHSVRRFRKGSPTEVVERQKITDPVVKCSEKDLKDFDGAI